MTSCRLGLALPAKFATYLRASGMSQRHFLPSVWEQRETICSTAGSPARIDLASTANSGGLDP
jgi:hypothetical protein